MQHFCLGGGIVRDWAVAQTPPQNAFEFDLAPSNDFLTVEAEIQ